MNLDELVEDAEDQEKSDGEHSDAGSQPADEDYDVDEEYDNDYAENYFDNGEGDDMDDLGGGGGDEGGGGESNDHRSQTKDAHKSFQATMITEIKLHDILETSVSKCKHRKLLVHSFAASHNIFRYESRSAYNAVIPLVRCFIIFVRYTFKR